MKFSTRNAFYLRASNYRVVPLFLYLDERHTDWMTDETMQLVIREMQSSMPELLSSASRFEKKHKPHVKRGETYQYCYFLRNTTRTEVVLLKKKTFSLRAPSPPPRPTPIRETKKKSATPRVSRSSRARSRSASIRRQEEEEEESGIQIKPDPDAPPTPGPSEGGGDEQEEEVNIKDWKPDVDVTFRGFGISAVQIVLIVEPYPPLPPSEYAPPSSRLSSLSASIATSRSRSRLTTGVHGASRSRYSSTSLAPEPEESGRSAAASSSGSGNMRNASRSVSAVPHSRRGGTSSVTPFRENSTTPGLESGTGSGGRGRYATPLFMPRDTPFGEDDEDEEAHEEYTTALREGRLRLPSVSRPAGADLDDLGKKGKGRKRKAREWSMAEEDEEDEDDIPETMEAMSERLVRSSEIEEGIVRIQAGWEERAEGEESAVMGREEPGD